MTPCQNCGQPLTIGRQQEAERLGPAPQAGGRMNVSSLFAGIGGLDLGLERAGMTIVGQVELDEFRQRVLAKHWPEVPRYGDVRTCVGWWRSEQRSRVDLIAGGFPCQPVSEAGQRLGAVDERWLWPPMASVIEALRPTWVLWENVPGLRTTGLRIVHADLVRLGYRHRVGWASVCSVGAPHPRRRLFGVSHTARVGRSPGRREPCDAGETTGVPDGVDRRRALGNAVVPRGGEYIGRLIMAATAKQVVA